MRFKCVENCIYVLNIGEYLHSKGGREGRGAFLSIERSLFQLRGSAVCRLCTKLPEYSCSPRGIFCIMVEAAQNKGGAKAGRFGPAAPMDVFTAVKKRRSVRRFKENGIPQETLEKLLDAARLAPSAGNVQPWRFIAVRNKEVQQQLARAALGQRWMTTAPVIIVVCAELPRSASAYGQRGVELYALQDTAAAIENLLLCAVEEGLGGCWVGAFNEQAAADVLGLDGKKLRPVALVPVGYPGEDPAPPPKRPLKEITAFVD